ncbi:MAG: DUF58 domain-containing protein [Candidatus Wallbacteria bacterium]
MSEVNSKYKYFDPAMLASLQNIKIAAKFIIDGFTIGHHKSRFRGFNVEFSQHRQYMPGDEIKNIDWKIFARTDKYYVREFEEDVSLKAYVLLDCSDSMRFKAPGAQFSKFDYASFLTVAFSYIVLKQQDSIGLVTFADRVLNFTPASASTSHFKVILDGLESAKTAYGTNLSESFSEVAARIKRRSLVIIITDLYDDENEIIKSIKHLKHKHHDVAVFHLMSDFERDLPISGETQFIDLENASEIITNAEQLRADYKSVLNKFINDFKARCAESFVDYNLVSLSAPIDEVIYNYLKKSERR